MAWYMCPRRHVIESRIYSHRLIFCGLCKKLLTKKECQKIRIVKAKLYYGITRHGSYKASNNPMFGKHHSLETRQKMSEALKKLRSGEKKEETIQVQ